MLAGDTYLINFQNDEATPPTRYERDLGELFGARGNGLSYGWSSDHTDQARERSRVADQRFDTLIHIEAGQNWEFGIANGAYEVTVAVGDPDNNDGIHTVNVEGVNFFSAVPDTNTPMIATRQVTISDGRMTLDAGAAAEKDTRINHIHIVGVPDEPNAAPSTPTVTEPATAGQVVNPADVHMEAIGFFDSDGDAHKSSDWEIWTVGPGAEPVWQTLGIEGVERLHTHLGDGVFLNSQAGQTSLTENTDYELRVRFRDDAGSVSGYAIQPFRAGAESTTFPMEIGDILETPAPTWEDLGGAAIELPAGTSILSPGDAIIAIDTDGGGQSSYPGNESPQNAIDGTLEKYLNFGEVNSGFIVTPSAGATLVNGFQITTANDAEERDPSSWALYGTDDAIISTDNSNGSAENWTLIDSGVVSLPSARNTAGPIVSVDNDTLYTSYRMLFTGVKNVFAANSMQIAEIQFFGDLGSQPTAATLSVETSTGDVMLEVVGSDLPGNVINHFPALPDHGDVRLVIVAGSSNVLLPRSDLTVTDEVGQDQLIFLPAINLPAGERLDLWVAASGATYFGAAEQTEPDFSFLARPADLDIPYIATQPGFVIEEVGSDYRLPVNIAFVPNPGPNPDDPLYYVTELYGSIQVVTRDGTKHEFATGLLDYNPQGPISGSGEQGLTGITVQRDETNPEIYHLYVGMLWDNGQPNGNTHFPKIERIDSVAGGLTMDARTVLLNMQPETQGQSHQISNITIGPDGKLYVHNGDGFNAGTAQDLDQYRGKVLRMNLDGSAPEDNPFYNAADGINSRDYVFAYGLRNPFGGAWRASNGKHYSVENGPSVDRFAQIDEGVNYGWNGSNASMFIGAIYNWNPSHAPVNITFVQPETFGGSQFPASMQDLAFVSESGPTYAGGPQANGKRIVQFELDANGALLNGPDTLIEYVGTGHSSVVGLAAGPDGLYFSDLYEDSGAAGPTAAGSRIYRVRYVNPLLGDYDIDGDVDQDDLTVWKETYGSNLLLAADGNRDGVVDSIDYAIWRENLGQTVASTASLTGQSAGQPLATEILAPEATSESIPSVAPPAEAPAIFSPFLPDSLRFRPPLRSEQTAPVSSELDEVNRLGRDDALLILALESASSAGDRDELPNASFKGSADSSSETQVALDEAIAKLHYDIAEVWSDASDPSKAIR